MCLAKCEEPTVQYLESYNNNKQYVIKFIHFNSAYFFLMFIFLFSFTQVIADSSYIDEAELFEDVPIVVSATRLKQKITDAPVSVTIIDSKMIAASGATEIHELLRYVPGFFSYSIWGNQFAVSNHLQPNDVGIRLEVQVNGRSVYEPLFTMVDWPALGIDIADVDYIEVIRGSSATVYGSNAFLGAINIVTKDVISRPKTSLRTRLGNIGRKELVFNHSGNIRDLNYGLSLVYKKNTGFPALKHPKTLRDYTNDDRDSLNLSFQGSYMPNLENEFQFDLGLGQTKVEIPNSLALEGYSTRKHKTNYQRFKWINRGKEVENTLQFYHSQTGINDDITMGLLSDAFSIPVDQIPILFPEHKDEILRPGLNNSSSERFDIEFEQKSYISKVNYVWGLGARRNQVKSLTLFNRGTKTDDRFRLFGNLDWRVSQKLNVNIGLLTEHTKYSGLVYSPRLAINIHPEKNHTFRASITSGKRVPSATFQEYKAAIRFQDGTLIDMDTVSVGNLGVETVTALELAYIAKIPKINTQFDVKLFREEMKNFVGLQIRSFDDLDKEARFMGNFRNATTQGIEIQATHKFDVIPDFNARLSYAYFETSGNALRDARDPMSIVKTSALPKHSGTLLLTKKLTNNFDISSTLQYQSDYRHKNVGIKRIDLRLGKKLKVQNAKGKINFVVQNITNKYNDYSARNEFKTRAFVQLNLDF